MLSRSKNSLLLAELTSIIHQNQIQLSNGNPLVSDTFKLNIQLKYFKKMDVLHGHANKTDRTSLFIYTKTLSLLFEQILARYQMNYPASEQSARRYLENLVSAKQWFQTTRALEGINYSPNITIANKINKTDELDDWSWNKEWLELSKLFAKAYELLDKLAEDIDQIINLNSPDEFVSLVLKFKLLEIQLFNGNFYFWEYILINADITPFNYNKNTVIEAAQDYMRLQYTGSNDEQQEKQIRSIKTNLLTHQITISCYFYKIIQWYLAKYFNSNNIIPEAKLNLTKPLLTTWLIASFFPVILLPHQENKIITKDRTIAANDLNVLLQLIVPMQQNKPTNPEYIIVTFHLRILLLIHALCFDNANAKTILAEQLKLLNHKKELNLQVAACRRALIPKHEEIKAKNNRINSIDKELALYNFALPTDDKLWSNYIDFTETVIYKLKHKPNQLSAKRFVDSVGSTLSKGYDEAIRFVSLSVLLTIVDDQVAKYDREALRDKQENYVFQAYTHAEIAALLYNQGDISKEEEEIWHNMINTVSREHFVAQCIDRNGTPDIKNTNNLLIKRGYTDGKPVKKSIETPHTIYQKQTIKKVHSMLLSRITSNSIKDTRLTTDIKCPQSVTILSNQRFFNLDQTYDPIERLVARSNPGTPTRYQQLQQKLKV